VVSVVGWLPASCGQVRMSITGAASTSSPVSATSANGSGRRPTRSAQRRVRVSATSGLVETRSVTSAPAAARSTASGRCRRRSTRIPASPHRAGTSVIAVSMTARTTANVA
jgi:hypothetical protein